jgi:hypothetical protein
LFSPAETVVPCSLKGGSVPTIEFSIVADVPAERVLAALTDFSERRPTWWPNLDPAFFRVHSLGPTTANVTEGSSFAGGVWERGTYDWSTPGVVRFVVEESNAFAPGSSWEYRVTDLHRGARVDVAIRRVPRTARARAISLLLQIFGRRIFRRDLERTIRILDGPMAGELG